MALTDENTADSVRDVVRGEKYSAPALGVRLQQYDGSLADVQRDAVITFCLNRDDTFETEETLP